MNNVTDGNFSSFIYMPWLMPLRQLIEARKNVVDKRRDVTEYPNVTN